MGGICDTAIAAGNFKTLVAATQAANLVETLNTKGPLTVFAPTDEAFAKLPKGTVEGLLKDIAKLTAILTYHVVSGKVMAADVAKLKTAKTLQGQELKIDAAKWHFHKSTKINDANVVKADVLDDNGVIHVIDKVLLPK
ncbi:MAG TPA: fasciclin domain-containing protein [Candidatus Nanoarchaeia archaeon]|nr:fasciclin domain-containing protein [Candidatus Nanoarchaeia archaeon]